MPAALAQDARPDPRYAAAGVFATGLFAAMPAEARCPEIGNGFAAALNRSGRPRKDYATWSLHLGTDFPRPEGTPVLAIADGRVVALGHEATGADPGNFVTVEHPRLPGGVSSNYVHLSAFNVDLHQTVMLGQVIGWVGSSGQGVTYPHLHLNIYGERLAVVGNRKLRYRFDYLQVLSGDMSPIDPAKQRPHGVSVAYQDQHGTVHPSSARVIWPFACERS